VGDETASYPNIDWLDNRMSMGWTNLAATGRWCHFHPGSSGRRLFVFGPAKYA
jgi:hypothetical protein